MFSVQKFLRNRGVVSKTLGITLEKQTQVYFWRFSILLLRNKLTDGIEDFQYYTWDASSGAESKACDITPKKLTCGIEGLQYYTWEASSDVVSKAFDITPKKQTHLWYRRPSILHLKKNLPMVSKIFSTAPEKQAPMYIKGIWYYTQRNKLSL